MENILAIYYYFRSLFCVKDKQVLLAPMKHHLEHLPPIIAGAYGWRAHDAIFQKPSVLRMNAPRIYLLLKDSH